ncbi:MAG: AsmA family protein, partial [Alphaproteobacteria bacterium]|nr:AsmA family protein [Alphaproteobacteria bacterium]
MRRLRLAFLAFVGLIVAAIGAAGVFIATVDPNDYRGVIADRLQAIAGQPVMLRGPLRWSIGLMPTVSAEDVMVGAPDGSSGQSMRVGAVAIQVELIPFLMERAVRVRRLVVRDAAIVLDLPAATAGASAGAPVPLPMLPDIAELEVRVAVVTVRDVPRGQAWQLAVARALVRAESDQLNVAAEGRFNEQAFTVEGRAGRFAMLSGSAPYPVALAVTVGEIVRASVDGTIANALAAPSPDLTVTFEGAELQRAAALVGVAVPPLGAYRGELKLAARDGQPTIPQLSLEFGAAERLRVAVTGSVGAPLAQRGFDLNVAAEGREIGAFSEAVFAGQRLPAMPALGPFAIRLRIAGDQPSFEDLRVQVGRENGPRAVVTGRIDRPLVSRGLAVEVQAHAPDGAQLARLLRLDLPLRGAVAFQARVSDADAARMRFQNLRATVGPNDLTGDVTIAHAGARPGIAGEIAAARIDVAALSADSRRAPASADGRVFSDAPLPFDLLGLADAELRVRAARVDGLPV